MISGFLVPLGGWTQFGDHDGFVEMLHPLHDPSRWNYHEGDEFFPDGFAYVAIEEPSCLFRIDLAEGGVTRIQRVFVKVGGSGSCASELLKLLSQLEQKYALRWHESA
jgi:hypothetical protein